MTKSSQFSEDTTKAPQAAEVQQVTDFEIGDEVTVQYGLPTDVLGCRPEVPARVIDVALVDGSKRYLVQADKASPDGETLVGVGRLVTKDEMGKYDGQLIAIKYASFFPGLQTAPMEDVIATASKAAGW